MAVPPPSWPPSATISTINLARIRVRRPLFARILAPRCIIPQSLPSPTSPDELRRPSKSILTPRAARAMGEEGHVTSQSSQLPKQRRSLCTAFMVAVTVDTPAEGTAPWETRPLSPSSLSLSHELKIPHIASFLASCIPFRTITSLFSLLPIPSSTRPPR